MVVILLILLLAKYFWPKKDISQNIEPVKVEETLYSHILNGQLLAEQKATNDFFAFSVMIDNSYDIESQAGLNQASVVYEALAESNITRLLAVFSSDTKVEKIGPVRSARGYFLDLAQEYSGVFTHVGGSPQALVRIASYNFFNLDEMSANGDYFWRDEEYNEPHNVFISGENILTYAQKKEVPNLKTDFQAWNFVKASVFGTAKAQITVDFSSEHYQVDWHHDYDANVYQRWQDGVKKLTDQNATVRATNVIVQVAKHSLIDRERRAIDLKSGGKVLVFNKIGVQEGEWRFINGRTQFFDANNKPLELLAGTTWVEIVDDISQVKF
ncbi:MAG: hypothetical protein UR94_C0026G0010 [Parcubacteria group bacterium GW2011_GWA2_36_10]|nr:MAG: hypothetical protein UR94_C0026G0010 [Parcubacteria group bacterium GW2011_GWA2_36_10]